MRLVFIKQVAPCPRLRASKVPGCNTPLQVFSRGTIVEITRLQCLEYASWPLAFSMPTTPRLCPRGCIQLVPAGKLPTSPLRRRRTQEIGTVRDWTWSCPVIRSEQAPQSGPRAYHALQRPLCGGTWFRFGLANVEKQRGHLTPRLAASNSIWTSSSASFNRETHSSRPGISTSSLRCFNLYFETALPPVRGDTTALRLTRLRQIEMDKASKAAMPPPETPLTSGKGRPRQRRATADSQIDRKRELDRIAQRMSRERSRNRIIFLEQKLKSLEARDRGGQISYLMQVIEDLRQENTQLRASMMKIRFIADDLSEPANKGTLCSIHPNSNHEC